MQILFRNDSGFEFQSYNSSIKTSSADYSDANVHLFQSYNSSIKTLSFENFVNRPVVFQSYNSSIKTFIKFKLLKAYVWISILQ